MNNALEEHVLVLQLLVFHILSKVLIPSTYKPSQNDCVEALKFALEEINTVLPE